MLEEPKEVEDFIAEHLYKCGEWVNFKRMTFVLPHKWNNAHLRALESRLEEIGISSQVVKGSHDGPAECTMWKKEE